jgi:hypothetical protein
LKTTQEVKPPGPGWCGRSFKQQQQHNSNIIDVPFGEE